ncbi:MAG: DUF4159 domain-containing protein [Neomegalonema sp.]|nr:DUF4159 domain-containing protein [Neomegalonema sp.]
MFSLGTIGFLQPLFLVGLAALPLIWLLMRATPPRPRVERFPGVRVLLGLEDRERTPERTPWWLLLLRTLMAAFLLFAFAEPIVNPKARLAGEAPILVIFDGGWSSAADWGDRRDEALDLLAQAEKAGRTAAVLSLAEAGAAPERITFETAAAASERLAAMKPAGWRPDPKRILAAVRALAQPVDIYWLHAGQAVGPESAAKDVAALADALATKGALTLIGPKAPALVLAPVKPSKKGLSLKVLRAAAGEAKAVRIVAYGRPPTAVDSKSAAPVAGVGIRRLAETELLLAEGATEATGELELPVALANAVDRVEISGVDHAGAVALIDDRSRRRVVALVASDAARSEQPALSGITYLRSALAPFAALRETSLPAALGLPEATAADAAANAAKPSDAAPASLEAERPAEDARTETAPIATTPASTSIADVIILVDVARMDAATEAALRDWVNKGGLLVRFAGPRLAALAAERRGALDGAADDLLPVALRGGGRALGGALSWEKPQKMRPFEASSPFAGLKVPSEVTISRQVLAEPSPALSGKVWAMLEDGTPLVTSNRVGSGRVVLFHVAAAPGWSSLPLSGLYVEMMDRLVATAPALSRGVAQLEEDGRSWRPTRLLDGFGALTAPESGKDAPTTGSALKSALRFGATASAAPGYYAADDGEGGELTLAVSAVGAETIVAPRPPAPSGAAERILAATSETELKAPLLAAGFALLLIDALAALFLAGGLRKGRQAGAALIGAVLLGGALTIGAPASAQTAPPTLKEAPAKPPAAKPTKKDEEFIDPAARRAALDTVLAYVVTGDAKVDRASAAGVFGLSRTLYDRTAIEPGEPAGVNLETDDLAVYALIYWPITAAQPDLSDTAVRKLNKYLRTGGMIVVDTQDAHRRLGAAAGPNAPHLKRLIGRLDLPALEPLPKDHVMTRSFYLINEAPGRWGASAVWVAVGGGGQLDDARAKGGKAARLRNDGVSPIVLGSVDWAAAWATDKSGRPLFPIGGEESRIRETARRFGVNLVMYAYTGNYKTDQVHIREVLERVSGSRGYDR